MTTSGWVVGLPLCSCGISPLHCAEIKDFRVHIEGSVELVVANRCTGVTFLENHPAVCESCKCNKDLVPTLFGGVLCLRHALAHCGQPEHIFTKTLWTKTHPNVFASPISIKPKVCNIPASEAPAVCTPVTSASLAVSIPVATTLGGMGSSASDRKQEISAQLPTQSLDLTNISAQLPTQSLDLLPDQLLQLPSTRTPVATATTPLSVSAFSSGLLSADHAADGADHAADGADHAAGSACTGWAQYSEAEHCEREQRLVRDLRSCATLLLKNARLSSDVNTCLCDAVYQVLPDARPQLLRVLKMHGWTGSQFHFSPDPNALNALADAIERGLPAAHDRVAYDSCGSTGHTGTVTSRPRAAASSARVADLEDQRAYNARMNRLIESAGSATDDADDIAAARCAFNARMDSFVAGLEPAMQIHRAMQQHRAMQIHR
jgi:hypothetical protein